MEGIYPVPIGPKCLEDRIQPLALVEVSYANKLELLEKSIRVSYETLPQTQNMLAQLQQFQPSIARLFRVKGTAISRAPLRLLCEGSKQLQQSSPPQINSYIALSYCWHGPDWQVADSLGHSEMGWPISTAMLHGLLDQREFPDEGVWIDQYCINQQDPLDKTLAIGCMDLFYKSARKVIVILEDVGLSEIEEALLQKVRINWKPEKEDLDALADIIIRILSARWFQRAWCSHELQLSNELIFLLPTKETPAKLSPDDLESLYSVTSDYILQDESLVALMTQNIFRGYDFFTRTIERKLGKIRGRSLISEFADIHELACSSQTDILCIAMNISGLQVYFAGRIRSRNECRWVLAMVALSAGDATVLGGVDEALMVESRTGVPSWLHWANDLESTMTRVGYSNLPESMSIRTIDQYHITLDLLDFTNCALWHPSQHYYNRADLLVKLLSQAYANESLDDQAYWMKPNPDPIEAHRKQRFVVEILACSFECGFEWMTKQMLFAPKLAHHVQDLSGDFGSRFWPMLVQHTVIKNSPGSRFLEQLDSEKKMALLQYFYFILFDTGFDFGSLPSFLPVKSPASPGEHSQDPERGDDQDLIQCLDIGLGNKALVALRPGVMEKGRLVMPVALSDSPCADIRRLWLVKSSSLYGGKVGKLFGKFHMFTLMPIEENAFIIKRRHQIIIA